MTAKIGNNAYAEVPELACTLSPKKATKIAHIIWKPVTNCGRGKIQAESGLLFLGLFIGAVKVPPHHERYCDAHKTQSSGLLCDSRNW